MTLRTAAPCLSALLALIAACSAQPDAPGAGLRADPGPADGELMQAYKIDKQFPEVAYKVKPGYQLAVPQLTSLAPSSGVTGTVVTASGAGFNVLNLFGPTVVRLGGPGGVTVPYTWSGSTLQFVVPALPGAGAYKVELVVLSGSYAGTVRAASPVSFTFTPPLSPPVVQVTNSSQGRLTSIAINGVEVLAPSVLDPGQGAQLPVAAGLFSFAIRLDLDLSTFAPFGFQGTAVAAAGQTAQVTVPALTVGMLLTGGRVTRTFGGVDFSSGSPVSFQLIFNPAGGASSQGTWTEVVNGAQVSTGSLGLVSWPALSSTVTFSLQPGLNLTIADPWAQFFFGTIVMTGQ